MASKRVTLFRLELRPSSSTAPATRPLAPSFSLVLALRGYPIAQGTLAALLEPRASSFEPSLHELACIPERHLEGSQGCGIALQI